MTDLLKWHDNWQQHRLLFFTAFNQCYRAMQVARDSGASFSLIRVYETDL